jgi:hypothetical protein
MRSILPRFSTALAVLAAGLLLGLVGPARGATSKAVLTLPVERDNWYAIKWENNLIGYSHFSLEAPVQLGSDQFYVLNSSSRIKLSPAENSDVTFVARLLLNRATLEPSLFICSQKQGKVETRVECLFTPRLVAQKNSMGNQDVQNTINVEAPPFLVFNNVWGRVDTLLEHYAVLLAAWKARGEAAELTVYEPVLRGTESLKFAVEGKSTVPVLGKEVPTRTVLISDPHGPLARAYVADSGRLLRLDDLHGGFTFTLSDPQVEALVKKAVGVNLYKNRVDFSNVYFPNANDLRNFKARLEVRINGVAHLSRDIQGFRQTFDGTVDDGTVKGTVDIASHPVHIDNSTAYPRREPYGGDLAKYVGEEPGIEAKDEEVRSKAEEVAWRSRTSWEAAGKINTWVHDKVADGFSMPSGRYVLQRMAGNSESKALLVVTLLRSLNIPARKVTGILFSGGDFVPHSWAEVYVGDDGWVALDPTTGEAGTLGATHVALGESGDVASMDVQVVAYGPHPPARVAFFNKELAWPVGQQRVYSIIHGGKEIGKETARVKGLTSLDGKDAYEMEFSHDLTLDKKHRVGSAKLITTPDVLPRRFSVEASVDNEKTSHNYEIGPTVVKENIALGDETRVQETPISEGAYVVDPRFISMYALIIGQLPNPAMGTKATIHLYDPETHNTRPMALEIRQEEKIGVDGEERDTWRCESTDGMSFFIEKRSGQVIRIEMPRQDMVLQLTESAIKI